MKSCKNCGKDISRIKHGILCGSCRTKIRRIRAKIAAVKYLGSKCKKCGYSENVAALQFHHKEADDKEFTIGNISNRSWRVIKKELDKCELLCANCHLIIHSKRDDKLMQLVQDYKGKQLEI